MSDNSMSTSENARTHGGHNVECEAQNLRQVDKLTCVSGDRYDPPTDILTLDMNDCDNGWVWVCVVRPDVLGKRFWYRLGIYELVEVSE